MTLAESSPLEHQSRGACKAELQPLKSMEEKQSVLAQVGRHVKCKLMDINRSKPSALHVAHTFPFFFVPIG